MSEGESIPTTPPRKRRRWQLWFLRTFIAIVLLIAIGEAVSRYYLGLGDPPLMMSDPKIEYLYQPNQTRHRFGNFVHYNAYSMRSDDFPARKSSSNELRVMVIGDSVINGGTLTDQSNLATTMLQSQLSRALNRPTLVGNISAGSWGPPNELAYVERYGLFDADVVVIELSSHDIIDVPTFGPAVGVLPDMPARTPPSALVELFTRYLLPRLHIGNGMAGDLPPPSEADGLDPKAVAECEAAVREMIRLGRAAGATPIIALHPEPSELKSGFRAGHDKFLAVAASEKVRVVDWSDAFRADLARGANPFRDTIHPNPEGQHLMADALLPAIEAAVQARAAASAPTISPMGR